MIILVFNLTIKTVHISIKFVFSAMM